MNVYDGAELTDEGARFWLALDGWDAIQSVYLLCAIDPRKLNKWAEMSGGEIALDGFPAHFDSLESMLAVAFDASALHSPAKPSDVIAWAKSKGLRMPKQLLDAHAAGQVAPTPEPVATIEGIPGTLPLRGAGRLAIKAAWQIECETKRRASAKEVMTLLQAWADDGKESDTLIKSLPAKRAVLWLTAKSEHREYATEACRDTLRRWNKSRQ
ncbi:MAG: hypothetical protein K8F26_14475 [Thiobacillus sp.]|nr:hypothetical protein [Thiobacillus sp.]